MPDASYPSDSFFGNHRCYNTVCQAHRWKTSTRYIRDQQFLSDTDRMQIYWIAVISRPTRSTLRISCPTQAYAISQIGICSRMASAASQVDIRVVCHPFRQMSKVSAHQYDLVSFAGLGFLTAVPKYSQSKFPLLTQLLTEN